MGLVFRIPEQGGKLLGEVDGSVVASVDRALRILQELSRASQGLSLNDLAVRLGIPKSSLHRILGALKHRRFVTQP